MSAKRGLVGQKCVGDAMHFDRGRVDLRIGLKVDVKVVAGEAPFDQLDATDLDIRWPFVPARGRWFLCRVRPGGLPRPIGSNRSYVWPP